jgi:SnoaL-like polyketide cyclase
MPRQQDAPIATLEHLEEELRGLSPCWQPRAQELRDFLERWEQGWNTHDLDALQELVSEEIVWEDPAMHGETVHGRAQFKAFTETFFRAFPDVTFQGIGTPLVDLAGAWMGVRWRMTGTFTGELEIWSKQLGASAARIAPTGNSFDIEGIDLYELHDGVLASYTIHYDLLGLSQQLGLFS